MVTDMLQSLPVPGIEEALVLYLLRVNRLREQIK
jgi:hypothetical protein